MDHHLRMLMLHEAQKASETNRVRAEVGDLALFHGRLVEVVEVSKCGDHNNAAVVELTDAGGMKRRFWLDQNPWAGHAARASFRVLQRGDKVLDSIALATPDTKNPCVQLQLRTERWMADPQPGDLFHSNFSFWVLVDAVHSDGRIDIQQTESFDISTGWTWERVSFPNAHELRWMFECEHEPGYGILSHSSRRTSEVPIIPVF